MKRTWLRRSLQVKILLLASFAWFGAQQAHAQNWYRPFTEESQPDVFYNFYVSGDGGGVPAAMYPAPLPTPPLVGHTYYTYQPLMPHEFLYQHHRTYHQYYNGGMGLNRTKVRWYAPPVRTAVHGIAQGFKIPR